MYELVRREKLFEFKHAKRKFKARRLLTEKRAKRAVGVIASALPTGAIKLRVTTKGIKKVRGPRACVPKRQRFLLI
jgi:hypothetical protein